VSCGGGSMGVSLPERLREDSEGELVGFDHDEVAGYGGCEAHEEEGECGCGGEDDRAGELLCFLMELQATAMESFGGGSGGGGGADAGAGAAEFDPKLYGDLPLKGSLHVTAAAFHALPRDPAGSVAPGSGTAKIISLTNSSPPSHVFGRSLSFPCSRGVGSEAIETRL
jgi:hypothetical protein